MVTYKEPMLAYHNLGNGPLGENRLRSLAGLQPSHRGRGLATADFLNDGAVDLPLCAAAIIPS